jgi:hypothetical protein
MHDRAVPCGTRHITCFVKANCEGYKFIRRTIFKYWHQKYTLTSEQVIPITVSQVERGIENPCVDSSIPPLITQLFAVWLNSGDYLFTSFDFNADCLPVGFRWRSGQLLRKIAQSFF